MGGRWLSQVWFFLVLMLVACGDNVRNNDDAGPVDDAIDAPDAPPDGPPDAPPDGPPDAPPDAACSVGGSPMYCPTPGGCSDLDVDPLNCGACGTVCDTANGEMCLDGVCCASGQVNCSGTCINPVDDEANCGGCGTVCTANQTCTNGACTNDCTGTEMNCGTAPGTCVDTMTDPDFCGDCNTACSPGTACVGGTCQCDTPDTCSGTCTNTNNDPANCGTCGTMCDVGDVCNNGVCTTSCASPTTNCSGSCANVTNDPFNCGQCGTVCDAGEVCNAGSCTTTCTSPTTTECNGACANTSTDVANCGSCGNACALGATCSGGGCACPIGSPDICDGACTNDQTDEANCGGCGVTCTTDQSCNAGVCTTVCGIGTTLCGSAPGVCANLLTDNNNCGGCNLQCDSGEACTNGVCLVQCSGATPDRCDANVPPGFPGFCTNDQTDPDNCGACGNECLGATATAAAQVCNAGTCACVAPDSMLCNGACTDIQTDGAHCGGCNQPCDPGELCDGGTCVPDCVLPTIECNGSCVNTTTDEANCGACDTACPFEGSAPGSTCTSGTCSPCATGPAAGCPAVGSPPGTPNSCANPMIDPDNCGGCGIVCGFNETCSGGTCCGAGEVSCSPGTCTNTNTDPNNCGGCGAPACGNGQTCNNGTCECPYGQSLCGGTCIVTSVDPLNCGGCGNVPNPGDNICPAGQACVSNGCSTTCPPPLTKCGNQCVNLNTDNNFCGSCSNAACTGNTGCSDGACSPLVPVGADPAKCVGGGPPIFVPTGGGETCTGNLGSVSFTFGLCSRTDVGPLSQAVRTDAFDSTQGPYVPGMKGGGIGVNGQIASNKVLSVGGDLWVAGLGGLEASGDLTVRQDLRVLEQFKFSKLVSVEEDAYIGGPIIAQGAASGTITGDGVGPALHTEMVCGSVPSALSYAGCVTEPITFPAPPCGTSADLIPVRTIVDHFAANNDNALIGLDPNALRNNNSTKRLELPCGYYHLTSISGSGAATIVAHGRTALFISGAIDTAGDFYIDLEPGATLDIFIGGVMTSSKPISIGNPAYPRLSRLYIGSPSCKGTGTCASASECCSGECSNGQCASAGGLTNSLKLSGGDTYLNGVFWAGYGEIQISNPLEMYGALFTNYIDAAGDITIHYDEGVVQNGEECPPLSGTCDTCRDCDNQACVGGMCGACTSDAQCCAPLSCVNPGPQGRCEL